MAKHRYKQGDRTADPKHMRKHAENSFAIAKLEMTKDRVVQGKMVSIMTLGDQMYAAVRKRVSLANGSHEFTHLLGYPDGYEGDATFSEVYIPVDRSARALTKSPEGFIGEIVDVVMGGSGKYPKYVMMNDSVSGLRGQPFSITTGHVARARAAGNGDLSSDESRKVLADYNYSDEDIDALLEMRLEENRGWEGNTVNFAGDAPTPWTTHKGQVKGQITLPASVAKLVKKPPTGKLKRKNCYLPPKAFTGK